MIKNENGVTLIVLVVTIIILSILAGIGISETTISLNESSDDKLNLELGMVLQVVNEQYIKAYSTNQLNKSKDVTQLSVWKGTALNNFDNVELPQKDSLNNKLDENIEIFYEKIESYSKDTCENQEDFYYRLTPEDLKVLGLIDAKDTYIVNYKNKEVYNETQKVNSQNDLLYTIKN